MTPLIEYTLDGRIDRIAVAIERLRSFCPPEGYWVAFSGGKDSVVLYDLAVKAGVQFDAHYQVTTVDPPEVIRFIREHYPTVRFERPEQSMWQLVAVNGYPPTRIARYCCEELKERGGEGRTVITGVRWAESVARRKRGMAELCYKTRRNLLHPIIDWSDSDVWDYIHQEQLPYCLLYDEGFKRIGCVMCPMGATRQMERDARRWPRIYNAYLRAFDRMIADCAAKGKPRTWQTTQEVMDWWIYGRKEEHSDQYSLFGDVKGDE